MKPWIKAGIVGGIVQVAFTLPIIAAYFMPLAAGAVFATCISIFFFLLYPVPGLLAAHWSPPLTTGRGASLGALAGLLASGIDSLATAALMIVVQVLGLNEQYIARVMPDIMNLPGSSRALTWGLVAGGIVMLISLVVNVLIGVGAGALGGIVYSALKTKGKGLPSDPSAGV